jgi:hypothetical protein
MNTSFIWTITTVWYQLSFWTQKHIVQNCIVFMRNWLTLQLVNISKAESLQVKTHVYVFYSVSLSTFLVLDSSKVIKKTNVACQKYLIHVDSKESSERRSNVVLILIRGFFFCFLFCLKEFQRRIETTQQYEFRGSGCQNKYVFTSIQQD